MKQFELEAENTRKQLCSKQIAEFERDKRCQYMAFFVAMGIIANLALALVLNNTILGGAACIIALCGIATAFIKGKNT